MGDRVDRWICGAPELVLMDSKMLSIVEALF